tara:strand:+ start:937 stop:1353 length:417 start_codon:yes stop_codon:yes gene_type:complete
MYNNKKKDRVKITKKRTVPRTYVPKTLSKEDKKKQIKSIKEQKSRPKLKSFKSKPSSFTERFKKKYGAKDIKWISKNIIKMEGINQIKKKGIAAYYNSGSRPNQTPSSWWKARLYSVILGGPARRIDKKIWDKYKIKK